MKQKTIDGDERDWISRKVRWMLGMNKRPGIGKRIKRKMNKRMRRDLQRDLYRAERDQTGQK